MRKVMILYWSGIHYLRSQEDIIKSMEEQMEQSQKLHPDLICFAEKALYIKGDHANWPDSSYHIVIDWCLWRKWF